MAAEVANAPIKTAMDIPDPIPPGNWMARQLRMLNDNSEGLLPPSAGSKRSWDKYNTTTHKDFLGPREFQLEEPNYEVEVKIFILNLSQCVKLHKWTSTSLATKIHELCQ